MKIFYLAPFLLALAGCVVKEEAASPPAVAVDTTPPVVQSPVIPPVSQTPVAAKPRFDLKTLFYAVPSKLDKAFGKPTGGNKIKAPYIDQMPGEFREYDYAPEMKHTLTRFYKNKCVMIQIELPSRFDEALEALRSVGIDASSVSPIAEAPMATRWTAQIGGTPFKDLAAINSSINGSSGFDTVQFELAKP